MKPVFLLAWILFFFIQAFSQINPPIRSGELIALASQFYDSGEYKKSLDLYRQIGRNDTNYIKALYGLALNYEADSQFEKAIQVCEEALKRRDHRELEPDIYNTYANTVSAMGQKEKSIVIFDEAIRKYPSYSVLYFNKGLALFEEQHYTEAEPIFKQTLLINPFQYSAHFYLGLCAIYEGRVMQSFLSFVGYLLVNPEGKYSKRCVNILAAISNAKDEILEYKSQNNGTTNENFAPAEEILLSKIAVDKEYKLKVSFDDIIFRQIQVTFEKLEYKEADADFWMQYYVPYYKKLFNEGQFENFIFWAFKNIQIKEIQDYNKKNKKDIDHFVSEAGSYFGQIQSTRLLQYTGRDTLRIRYLFSEGELRGRGELTADGKNYIGPWSFYFPAGNIKSIGQFTDAGREGLWSFYYFSGNLESTEFYKNGKLEGKQPDYSEFGVLTDEQSYSNGLRNGLQYNYYVNGRLSSISTYKAGKLNGEFREYYDNGQLSAISQYDNELFTGPFSTYFNSGQLKASGVYVKGNMEGPYKEFYENGQLSSEGFFKHGLRDKEWKNYYDNGKIKSTEWYVDTKHEGVEEDFYEDSLLQSRYNYRKGQPNGEAVSYDKDQKPYSKFQFSDGKLESAVYFDKNGKQISLSERKNNRIDLDIYRPDGTKSIHRPLNNNGNIDGTETNYYLNGKISEISEYLDGQNNGINTQYFMNGNKRYELTMKNGKQTGSVTNYFQNGKLESQGWSVDGEAEGNWNYYDELGKLTFSTYMVDGEISGFHTEYYPNGAKSIEKKYYKGCLEEMWQFDSTGRLMVYDSFPQFSGNFLLLYPNGNKMQEVKYVKGEFEGKLTQYYLDGSVEFVKYYKGGLSDSNYTAYYYQNIKRVEGQFKAGKRTGLWKFYNEDGRLESIEPYSYDELNGLLQYYNAENKENAEVPYRHGEKYGMSFNMDTDGSLINAVRYDADDVKGYTYNDKNGKPVPEIGTENGKLIVASFFQNGRPSRHCEYINNKLNGADSIYYANGKLRSLDNSSYGLYEGISREYYSNGNPEDICNYQNDHLQGKRLEYNDKGVLIRETNYLNGRRHGESKYYSANGELRETLYYYDGLLLSVKK